MAKKKTGSSPSKDTRKDNRAVGNATEGASFARTIFDTHERLIASGLVLFIAVLVLRDYLFYHAVYLFKDIGSDSHIALYPTICLYAQYLQAHGFPSWSFQFGIGQDLLPFIFRDPFDVFMYLGSAQQIPYLIVWKEFAKIVGGGLIFYQYLRLVVSDSFSRIVGSLVFAFGGFMIVGSGWHIFSFEAFSLALLMLSFETMFQKKSSLLFIVTIALIGISQPFNLFVYGVFLIIYSAVRLSESVDGFSWSRLIALYSRLAVGTVVGLLISAVFLIPNIIQLIESPRGSGLSSFTQSLLSKPILSFVDPTQLKSVVSRFFSNNLQGIGSRYTGWRNYLESPLLYSSVLVLSVLPLCFSRFSSRARMLYGSFLGLWLIPLFFPFFRYAYWLFSGDYYRGFALCVSVVIVFVSVRALSLRRIGQTSTYAILSAIVIAAYCALVAWSTNTSRASGLAVAVCYTCIVAYPLCIYIIDKAEWRQFAQIAIIVLLSIELVTTGYESSSNRKSVPVADLSKRVDYNDYSLEAVNYLHTLDNSFYRVMKTYSSSTAEFEGIDDAMIQNYYGVSVYNSFNQLDYVRSLYEMGLIDARDEWQSRAINWTGGLIEGMFAVKYKLIKDRKKTPPSFDHDSIAAFGDVVVERNKDWLPLGYCVDSYMFRNEFKKLSRLKAQATYINSCFVDERDASHVDGLRHLTDPDSTVFYDVARYSAVFDAVRHDTMHITSFTETHIQAEITVPSKRLLFISIPADKGWNAEINGKKATTIVLNGGLMGLVLEPGSSHIDLRFEHRYFTTSIALSCVGLIFGVAILMLERRRKDRSEESQTS